MKHSKRSSGSDASSTSPRDRPTVRKAKARPSTTVGFRLERVPNEVAELSPSVAIKVALLEVKRLQAAMRSRRKALAALPRFDTTAIDDLGGLARALRGADHEARRAVRRVGSHPVRVARKRAIAWRNEALEAARFLLRSASPASNEVDALDGGEGLPALVGDIDDLIGLVGANASEFARLPEPPELAEGIALAAALRDAVDDIEVIEALRTRNRAFWALEACAAEVRAGLTFVMRNDPKKVAVALSLQRRRRLPVVRDVVGDDT
ncbi:MAG: hypothetical protein U0414_07490 [Polyangiaceae bacterium]